MHRQLGPQPPLPTLPLRRQEWLPRTHSGASPRLDGPRQSSEEASALGQAPRSPVHADSLRSTVLTWEDLVLKQCIPILSLRGAHTVTSSDAGQAAPGPCPNQIIGLLGVGSGESPDAARTPGPVTWPCSRQPPCCSTTVTRAPITTEYGSVSSMLLVEYGSFRGGAASVSFTQ